jgi:hypothetical protein
MKERHCKWWWMDLTSQWLGGGACQWQPTRPEHENGLRKEIVALKYIRETPCICLIKPKISDSPVWSDLLKIRHIYLKGREYKLNNGKLISSWLDVWIANEPLWTTYPILYDL